MALTKKEQAKAIALTDEVVGILDCVGQEIPADLMEWAVEKSLHKVDTLHANGFCISRKDSEDG